MRGGFERLHGFCVHHMEARMNEGNAYVFFGKNRTRLKILVYDGSGLVLIAKKIERKAFMSHEELLGRSEITVEDLRLIFHGSVLRGPKFGAEADKIEKKRFPDFVKAGENLTTQREGFALPAGTMNAQL
ncbi:MAG: IS66 family insertion sequence element accessory protein TnpB [Bdellovibrionales bacterium]|nr:IS66 family insertion sequence element accessory protein TnpB [Bdellovibrionales bacterium]